jgi:hypothetical protein
MQSLRSLRGSFLWLIQAHICLKTVAITRWRPGSAQPWHPTNGILISAGPVRASQQNLWQSGHLDRPNCTLEVGHAEIEPSDVKLRQLEVPRPLVSNEIAHGSTVVSQTTNCIRQATMPRD